MYLALYRKYRPSTFDDVISQEHITTTLKNQIASGQIAHAYLFTGTRGTGKTSCAKIMAKAVNCLYPINGNPCGECEACRTIADGTTDIIEIDAASNNGVDSIRQIRDEVIYTPIDCKYKVYIIDEVHMLSDSAFNALLKTLEEPPEHAIFILATTEYYKVPATILSRCQQFLFSKIDPAEAKKRLLEVAEKEGIDLTENAAALIARLSDGAMRDAWSLLDQCVSSGGTVDEEKVRRCSGVADSGYLFAFSEAAAERDSAGALKLLDSLIAAGKDLPRLIEELSLHYRNLMITKAAGNSFVKGSDEELEKYKRQCEKLSLDEIMRQVDLVSDSLDNINRMKQTGQARLLTEQLLIRLCSPKLTFDGKSLAARLGAVESRLNGLSALGTLGASGGSDLSSSAQAEGLSEKKLFSEADTLPDSVGAAFDKAQAMTSSEKTPEPPLKKETADVSETNGSLPTEEAPPIVNDIPLPELPPWEDGMFEEIPPPAEEYGAGFASEPPPFIDYTDGLSDAPAALRPKENHANTEKTRKAREAGKGGAPESGDKAKNIGKETNAGESSEDKEAKAELPISEADVELPEGTPPLAQWNDIVSLLTPASKNILKSATAYLYGGKIYVDAPTSALSMMKNGKRAEKLRKAAADVMGGSFDIFTLPEKKRAEEKKEDLILPFLDKARAMGIEVTVKDR